MFPSNTSTTSNPFSGISNQGTNPFGLSTTTSLSGTSDQQAVSPSFGSTASNVPTSQVRFGNVPTFGLDSSSQAMIGQGATNTRQVALPSAQRSPSKTNTAFGGFAQTSGSSIFGSRSTTGQRSMTGQQPGSSLFGQGKDTVTSTTSTGFSVLQGLSANIQPSGSPNTLQSSPKRSLFGKKEVLDSTLFNKRLQPEADHKLNTSEIDSNIEPRFGKKTISRGEGDHQLPTKKRTIRREVIERKIPTGLGLFGKALGAAVGAKALARRKSAESKKKSPEERTIKPAAINTQRRPSADQSKVAIICKNVPQELNTKEFLRAHFSEFGKPTRVYSNPNKAQATIHFSSHEGALNAKKKGKLLKLGVNPMEIFWSTYSSTPKSPTLGIPRKKLAGMLHSEVNEELASMSGTTDIEHEEVKVLQRPKEVQRGITTTRETKEDQRGVSTTRETYREISPKPSPIKGLLSPAKSKYTRTLKETPCHTTSDRFELLKDRDKRYREAGTAKVGDVFVGTCQDMCPEKERYMREEQRRVHYYEVLLDSEGQNTSQIDHYRAVKEYSRSSADQEEPLPYELRPTEVLDMTMTYLLNNIMDVGLDGKWGDWFDFMWSRTRAIRKDITQQALCNLTSVTLIEKCARFHVYCAERLCEEDSMNFDSKINDENLTKCLQSLKEMYHDMATKHNTLCPNEAEFRAYMVLMNLNDSDILREVQQLNSAVRASQEIHFVLQVYTALNGNNYVRFFKLVCRATFLNACIMHRYFNQVRAKAFVLMIKAYRSRLQYPLDDLIRFLMFGSLDELSDFCGHYGLSVVDGVVNLSKNTYLEPDQAISQRRAIALIESKLTTTAGEAVNGQPLPPNILPEAHFSFDSKGRYSEDIPPLGGTTPDDLDEVSLPQARTQEKNENSRDETREIKEFAKDLFVEVINEMTPVIASDVVDTERVLLSEGENIAIRQLENVTLTMTSDVCKEVIIEQTKLKAELHARHMEELRIQKEREERERAECIERTTYEIIQELVSETVDDDTRSMAATKMSEVNAQLKHEQMLRCTDVINSGIVAEVVMGMVFTISAEVYAVDVEQRLEDLARNEKAVQVIRSGRFFKIWQNRYAKRLRTKRSMHLFPSAPSNLSFHDQLKSIAPNTTITNSFMKLDARVHMTIDTPETIQLKQEILSTSMFLRWYMAKLKREKAWSSLNIPNIIGPCLSQRTIGVSNHYWKLVISLPDESNNNFNQWIKSKFKRGLTAQDENDKNEVLSLYMAHMPGTKKKLGVCVRCFIGSNEFDTEFSLKGSSGMMFIESGSPHEDRVRLERFVGALKGTPCVPLVVLLFNKSSTYRIDSLSYVKVLQMTDDFEDTVASDQLHDAVQWLGESCPVYPQLRSQSLMTCLEDAVHELVYNPVYYDVADRRQRGLLSQDPVVIIDLYNSSLLHIASKVTSKDIEDISWPVAEFTKTHKELPSADWNTRRQLTAVQEQILSATLPDFDCCDMAASDWSTACHDVWNYVAAVCDEDEDASQLYTRVRRILEKSEAEFEDMCYLSLETACCSPSYVNMQWADVILACVKHRLDNVDNQSTETMVYYMGNLQDDFSPPESWKHAVINDNGDIADLNNTMQAAKEKCDIKKTANDSLLYSSMGDVSVTTPATEEANKSVHDLQAFLSREKQESEQYEKHLSAILQDGDQMENNDISYLSDSLNIDSDINLSDMNSILLEGRNPSRSISEHCVRETDRYSIGTASRSISEHCVDITDRYSGSRSSSVGSRSRSSLEEYPRSYSRITHTWTPVVPRSKRHRSPSGCGYSNIDDDSKSYQLLSDSILELKRSIKYQRHAEITSNLQLLKALHGEDHENHNETI